MTSIHSIIPNQAKVLMLAQRELAVYVYDAVQLEGINYTLPEIQTLLQGITVGGHKLTDQKIALNQANAWKFLFNSIKEDTFSVAAEYTFQLHSIAAKEEALEWGQFRTGNVTIAGTNYMPPYFKSLPECFNNMLTEIESVESIYDKAISLFLLFARNQFFYDVNKRMGRFMMNGLLLNKGYPAINLPAKRQLEFNQLMLDFYQSNNKTAMIEFMKSCLDQRLIKIMSE
ncbi:MAG: Fic family protein [Gammaproteobacteria bacterium]|nr:Fic family protein [Gammaproteobacteria bacterium]